ncbi:MAG: class I SAM-dependent methyltransferase [Clostridium sp.]|uniref:class I SAM-dependent methyltransferase n=1 Tax=Clostridium sp. TaxID=1506 RepID=UPI00303F7967
METIVNYYDAYEEDIRLIKDKAHEVEFITTINFLNKYINRDTKVLDIGAGTGRYSFHYAKRGMDITASDLSPKHVSIMRERAIKEGLNLDVFQGNVLNLENVKDNTFDVVLCLGPLYHLMSEEDRFKCIEECKRVLKPQGILAAAYINRFSTFIDMINRDSENINDEGIRKIYIEGKEYDDERDCFYFSTVKGIEELMNKSNVSKLEHIGTDGMGIILKEKINKFNETEFNIWMEYHLETCKEESLLGYSQHGLFIGRA